MTNRVFSSIPIRFRVSTSCRSYCITSLRTYHVRLSHLPSERLPLTVRPLTVGILSRPYKSAIQVGHTSRAIDIATAENRVGLVLSLLANGELSLRELMHAVGLRNRPSFYSLYILPAFEMGCVEYTIPDKPKSRLQKYRLTDKGRAMLTRAS